MSNSEKETEEFKSREVSECCGVSVGTIYTYPNFVESYKREYGIVLPYNREIKLCKLCRQECKSFHELK